MRNAISSLGKEAIEQKVMFCATLLGVPDHLHIDYVCNACCMHVESAPDFRKSRKNRILSDDQCIELWVRKFLNGYNSRISCRESNMPGTIPDDAVSKIIQAGLPSLPAARAKEVIYAHRLAMSAENILGLLLEGFLFEKLEPVGWAMAWGETIESVDFCDRNGTLLQIKNRSNSENSSSSKVREGKPIQKWYRVNATTGAFEWDNLESIIGVHVDGLTEDEFKNYISRVLAQNPKALAVEAENPWRVFRT